jgi:hypothetical protein
VRTSTKWIVGALIALLVVSGAAVVVFATGDKDASKQRASIPERSTTTTVPPTTQPKPPVAPLTGLPDPSGVSQTRPALSVKVENTPDARPQVGIDEADIVYEEEVEGNITRLVAMFNSTAPETIGPVRSVRAQDPAIVWPVKGIFAYSGGAEGPVNDINNAPVHAVDNTAAIANGVNGMERDAPGQPPRQAPHNLYGHGPALFSLGGDPKPPPPLFQYSEAGVPPPPDADLGEAVLSMRVGFLAGYDPTYQWDAASGTWKRFQLGQPHLVVGGAQIAPTNVVVQFTNYLDVSDAETVGEGDAWIFTGGRVRKGRWIRPNLDTPARYVDAAGNPILLTPGRTWVELLPLGYAVDVELAPAPSTTLPPATTAPTTTAKPEGKK